MKRIGLILSLTVLLVAMSSMFVFASGLQLDSTYPTDGQNNTSIENLGVKLYFNNEVADEETITANKDCFAIKDSDGKEIPIRILTSPDQEGIVMVLADYTGDDKAAENSTYTLYISGEFVDDSGNVLGKDQEISFTTLNQSRNTMINMGMMGVMFAAIFFVSQKAMKKNSDEKDKERYVPVNPYKESKKTGKSVEEIMEEESKRKAKYDAKIAKKAAKHKSDDSDEEDEDYDELEVNTYKVKKGKPISTVGGKTKSGMIEKAEEQAKKEAAKKKAQNYKKKK